MSGEDFVTRSYVKGTPHPTVFPVIKSRRMKWAGHVALTGKRKGAYWVLVGSPEEKRPLGKPRCRWEYNIEMDLQEIGLGGKGGLI